ncbi:hypothetical protein APED_33330 [Acanthopleuribacter pedis]
MKFVVVLFSLIAFYGQVTAQVCDEFICPAGLEEKFTWCNYPSDFRFTIECNLTQDPEWVGNWDCNRTRPC